MGPLKVPSEGLAYLDANCLIYIVEKIDPYQVVLSPLIEAATQGRITLITSELTLLECLVRPIRDKHSGLTDLFRAVLTESSGLRLAPITRPILLRAAELRAQFNIPTADAIHAATALEWNVTTMVSNDEDFRRISRLPLQFLGYLVR